MLARLNLLLSTIRMSANNKLGHEKKDAMGRIALGVLTGLTAYVLIRINVGNVDIGGPVGTFVVPSGSSEEDIHKVFILVKTSGLFLAVISIMLFRKALK